MLDSTIYDHIQSLWGSFARAIAAQRSRPQPQPPPPALLNLRAGYAESPGWFLLQAAEFDPEPLTVATLRKRDVYASEALVGALLEIMSSEKWFNRNGDQYALRSEGRTVLGTLSANRLRWLAAIPIPEQPAGRLHKQFERLINASLDTATPPGPWCLAHSRRRAPVGGSIAAELFQFVADFNAFRDDCHMASWQHLGVEGYVWEAFSLVAGGVTAEAEAVYDQLAYRGYGVQEYGYALRLLREKGWVTDDGANSTLTPNGQAVRAEAERLTDVYFYAPWASLAATEGVDQMSRDIANLEAQLERLSAQSV